MRREPPNLDLSELERAVKKRHSNESDVIPGWEKTYTCELVTPMFGGGVEAGKIDEKMPIRASSIRGHLRFWWRIVSGLTDEKEMFKQECDIWGGIGLGDGNDKNSPKTKASKVDVRVSSVGDLKTSPSFITKLKQGNSKKPVTVAGDYKNAYALFPGQKDKNEKEHKKIADHGLTFHLTIRFSHQLSATQVDQIKEAIRWWASFGGIGARTRRGLGAVWIKHADISPVESGEVKNKGALLIHVDPDVLKYDKNGEALLAWSYGIDLLQEFRQGIGVGRIGKVFCKKGKTETIIGRSLWPEAESVRNLTGCSDPKYTPTDKDRNLFPRAAFGLPINFQFRGAPKRKDQASKQKDPVKPELLPANDFKRMASPLILRPYRIDEKWHSAALLLPGWEKALTEELCLHPSPKGKSPNLWPTDDQQKKDAAKEIFPMNYDGSPLADDPLSAFLKYFEQRDS